MLRPPFCTIATHAIALHPRPTGTTEKNDASAALAMVYAQTSEPDKAISLIEHLLTAPVDLQRGAGLQHDAHRPEVAVAMGPAPQQPTFSEDHCGSGAEDSLLAHLPEVSSGSTPLQCALS